MDLSSLLAGARATESRNPRSLPRGSRVPRCVGGDAHASRAAGATRRRARVLVVVAGLLAATTAVPVPASAAAPPTTPTSALLVAPTSAPPVMPTSAPPVTRVATTRVDASACTMVDGRGATVIVFARRGNAPGLYVASNRSGAWRTSRITLTEGGDGWIPEDCVDATLDRSGKIHVVASGRRASDTVYVTNRGGAWTARSLQSSEPGWSSIVAYADGRVAILTRDDDGVQVVSNRTGAWRRTRVVRSSDVNLRLSGLAIDGNVRLHLGYGLPDGRAFHVSNETGTWVTRRIAAPAKRPVEEIQVGVDGYARPVAILARGGVLSVLARRSGGWTTLHRRLLDTNAWGVDAVAAGRNGCINVLLSRDDGSAWLLSNRTGPWRRSRIGAAERRSASLALTRAGTPVVGAIDAGVVRYALTSAGWRATRVTESVEWGLGGVAAGPTGAGVVVATRQRSRPGVFLFRETAGGWASARLTGDPRDVALDVAVGADGRIMALIGRGEVSLLARETALGWPIEEVHDGSSGARSLAIDDTGVPHVFVSLGSSTVERTPDAAGGWQTASTIAADCHAALFRGGTYHLACGAFGYAARTGSQWVMETAADPPDWGNDPWAPDYGAVSVSANARGQVAVGYESYSTHTWPPSGIGVARRDPGGTWSSAWVGNGVDHASGAAIVPDGSLRVAYGTPAGVAWTSDRDGTWTTVMLPVAAGWSRAEVATDPSGNPIVAVEQLASGGSQLGLPEPVAPQPDAGLFVVRPS